MLRFTALFFLLVASIQAQGQVEIRFANPKPGDAYTVSTTTSTKTEFQSVVNGNTDKKTETRSQSLAYTEKILELTDSIKQPTKLTRTYTLAENVVDTQKTTLPFVGQEILVQWVKDKYTFTVKEKAAEEELLKFLELDFIPPSTSKEKPETIFPTAAVKVGEKWKVSTTQFVKENAKEMPFDLKKDGHTATGTLKKTEMRNGALWGTIVMKVKLSLSAIKSDTPIPLRAGSVLNLTITIDGVIDGSSLEGTRKTETQAELEVNQPATQLKMKVTGTGTRTVTPMK